MSVNHRGFQIAVPQHLLNRSYIIIRVQQMGWRNHVEKYALKRWWLIEELDIAPQTVSRWRHFWREFFPEGRCWGGGWKQARMNYGILL